MSVGGRNFTAYQELVTWYDARDTCRWAGTDLAVFGGQNEINDVMSKLSSLSLDGHYWIGLTRIKWLSGWKTFFSLVCKSIANVISLRMALFPIFHMNSPVLNTSYLQVGENL